MKLINIFMIAGILIILPPVWGEEKEDEYMAIAINSDNQMWVLHKFTKESILNALKPEKLEGYDIKPIGIIKGNNLEDISLEEFTNIKNNSKKLSYEEQMERDGYTLKPNGCWEKRISPIERR